MAHTFLQQDDVMDDCFRTTRVVRDLYGEIVDERRKESK
jgi:hypothetical protein